MLCKTWFCTSCHSDWTDYSHPGRRSVHSVQNETKQKDIRIFTTSLCEIHTHTQHVTVCMHAFLGITWSFIIKRTYRVVVEHELDGAELHQFSHTAVGASQKVKETHKNTKMTGL